MITDRAEMASLYASGVPTRALAERYGVNPPAITRALNKMGIKPRKQAGMRDDDLAELIAEGFTQRAAAHQLGISEQRASQIWARICRGLGWQAQ